MQMELFEPITALQRSVTDFCVSKKNKMLFSLIINIACVNTMRNISMDEVGFYVPSTVFQSFRDDGRVNMKGSVQ